MKLIDTHCHLDIALNMNFDTHLTSDEIEEIALLVNRAADSNVVGLINVATGEVSTHNGLKLAQRYPGVYATGGLHPTDVKSDWREVFERISTLCHGASKKDMIAIGETGIDLYHTPDTEKIQKDAFDAQIELAKLLDLPLVVHVRDKLGVDRAMDVALDVLAPHKGSIRGTLHCFSQKEVYARKIINEYGFVIGIDGPVTYKNNQWLRDIVAQVPLESLVLETDAPFLTPQKYRGSKNEPAYLPLILEMVAQIRALSKEEAARVTTQTACQLFGISI